MYTTVFITSGKMIYLILKVDQLESSTVGEIAHKPAFFVPGTDFCFLLLVHVAEKFIYCNGCRTL